MERIGRLDRALVATVGVGVGALVLHLAGRPTAVSWLLGSLAVVMVLREGRRMVADIRTGTMGIDILAVMAITATIAVGEFVAAWIVVLMLTGGEALEDYASGRARRELHALLDRAPRIAHVRTDDGDLVDVDIDDVAIGDTVVVRPGEVVPVDGVLLDPVAVLDESQLTGESLPVERSAGDDLLSGAVNGADAVAMRATTLAADSQYQHIVALVRAAADSKAPMVRLADRIAVPFTLFAIAIAGLAWWVSGDSHRVAEVLVVATPCPLLIAAPVAFLAGMSRSSRNGIIVKDGGTLERLSRLATVAFDKTGTLTQGNPTVTRVVVGDDVAAVGALLGGARGGGDGDGGSSGSDDAADVWDSGGLDRAGVLLGLAASVEQYSGHALATSIVRAAEDRSLPVQAGQDAHEVVAHGITATVGGRRVSVGKAGWISDLVGGFERPELEAGEMSVHVAVEGSWVGSVILGDEVRAEATATLAQLRRQGVDHLVMLTGDGERTARQVADVVGVDQVHANCLPGDKVDVITALPHRPVMMVGDGVNDAPALAVADVGVAMGARGSTASSESADVVIMVDDVQRVATAVAIGARTTQVALQAIWLGVSLSVVLMVTAAFGLIPAVVGAGLQEVVDVACIMWALLAARPGHDEQVPSSRSAPRPATSSPSETSPAPNPTGSAAASTAVVSPTRPPPTTGRHTPNP